MQIPKDLRQTRGILYGIPECTYDSGGQKSGPGIAVFSIAGPFALPRVSIPAWHTAWPIGLFVGTVVVCVLLLRLSAWSRERNLRRKRAGLSRETFTASLGQYGFDPVITSSTYRYLQEVQLIGFPILPGDKLDEDLGLDTDEVEQSVRDLTIALRRELSPGLRTRPLVTVEDLIRLLQASPRLYTSGAEPIQA